MPFFSPKKSQQQQILDKNALKTRQTFPDQQQYLATTQPDGRHTWPFKREKAFSPVYKSLDASKQEIRLLKVHPGEDYDPLVCTSEITSLISKHHTPYETVSYCWGKDPGEAAIELDRVPSKITWSAARALHRLRYQDRCRLLWVDAICINQGCKKERSQQVAMMGTIYRQTWRNLVWLGNGTQSSKEVETALAIVAADMCKKTKNCKNLFEVTHERRGMQNLRKDGIILGKNVLGHLPALIPLFSRAWFGRLWVAQEVALAPTNVCLLGSASFSLNDVLRVAVWLRFNTRLVPTALIESPGFNKAIKLWYLVDSRCVPRSLYREVTSTLASTWQLLKWMETSTPKDNLYALLGMVCNKRSRFSNLALIPDYDKSDAEVFRDATRVMIEEMAGLTILQLRSEIGGDDGMSMPSWVIPFHVKRYRDPGPRPLASSFNAHDSHYIDSSTLSTKMDPNVLSVRGVHVDRVVRRTKTMPSLFKNNISQLIQEALQVVHPRDQKPDYWTWEFTEKFAMTLMAERDWVGHTAGAKEVEDFVEFMKYMSKHRQNPPTAPYGEIHQHDKGFQKVMRCFNAIAIACSKRCFFVTADGRFGLGPGGLAKRDVIAVLHGGALPFALRYFSNGRCQLVGACYVFGVMDGEAMRNHKADRKDDAVFQIV